MQNILLGNIKIDFFPDFQLYIPGHMCIHGRYAPDTVLVRGTEQRLGTRVDKHSQTNVYKKMIALKNKSLLLSEYFHSLFGTCVIK